MTEQEHIVRQKIEAVIFASEEAVPASFICQVLESGVSAAEVDDAVNALNAFYTQSGRAFRIESIAEGYRFMTIPALAPLLRKMLAPKIRRKLSQSVLEVLAVIAYQQPVSRSDIQHIRGVSPDYAVNKLLERGLIDVRGRAASVGKPLLYGTTKEFLDFFHLSSLKDLPKLREIRELARDKDIENFLMSSGDNNEQQGEYEKGYDN
ncbi:segregation and condensation protein B [Prosthecochloris aestuarii DSM 271]|uniref:Segregation and condensation protein B n=1 Tax=Prosthecochloris aestuarii (strain DSM 271 / SK 413) TaxID=290512 RepID=B4S4Z9_PROA2|nr:segregation and condensation protein B [Prosthecochloris aestuarii DSM 271]